MAPAPRFFIELKGATEPAPGDRYYLTNDDTRHAIGSLRLRESDIVEIALLPGRRSDNSKRAASKSGVLFTAKIVESKSEEAIVELLQAIPNLPQQPGVKILLQALLKGERNYEVCDQATALGVNHIIFFQAERSISKIKDAEKLTERLERITRSAAMQSRRDSIPQIVIHRSLADALLDGSVLAASLKTYASLETDRREPKHLNQLKSADEAALVIGPEGDLSPAECLILRHREFTPISLGQTVLRSELAAITGIVTLRTALLFSRDL